MVVLSVANPRTAFLADAYFNIIKCVCFSRFQRPDIRSCKHKRHYAPFFTTRAVAGKERRRRTRKISFAPIPVGVLSYTLDNIWFLPFSMYIRAAHVSQKYIHSRTHTRVRAHVYIALTCICAEKQFSMTHHVTDNNKFTRTRIYAVRRYSSIRFRFSVKR